MSSSRSPMDSMDELLDAFRDWPRSARFPSSFAIPDTRDEGRKQHSLAEPDKRQSYQCIML